MNMYEYGVKTNTLRDNIYPQKYYVNIKAQMTKNTSLEDLEKLKDRLVERLKKIKCTSLKMVQYKCDDVVEFEIFFDKELKSFKRVSSNIIKDIININSKVLDEREEIEMQQQKKSAQELKNDILLLSAGTMVSLGREKGIFTDRSITYTMVDELREKWLDFVDENYENESTWQESWHKFAEQLEQEETWDCFKCGEIDSPIISICIEFKDGDTYDELTDLEVGEDVFEYVEYLVKEKGWEEDYKDFSYGYYCPHCLNSVD